MAFRYNEPETVRVPKLNGLEGRVTVLEQGGGGSQDFIGYTHVQSVAAATWTVNHNLGHRPAAVTVLSPGGQEVGAGFLHNSDNQITVLFEQPQTGSVRVL